MKRLTRCAVLCAVSIVISVLEKFIPISAIIPLPGIKLGLSNIVILFMLIKFGFFEALAVQIIKCFTVSLLFSGALSVLYSLGGGLLALVGMYGLLKFKNAFSVYGVSVFGAALHSAGQIAVASLLLNSGYIFNYLPLLMLASVATGLITASVTNILCNRVEV